MTHFTLRASFEEVEEVLHDPGIADRAVSVELAALLSDTDLLKWKYVFLQMMDIDRLVLLCITSFLGILTSLLLLFLCTISDSLLISRNWLVTTVQFASHFSSLEELKSLLQFLKAALLIFFSLKHSFISIVLVIVDIF